jgi:hypothetical protein
MSVRIGGVNVGSSIIENEYRIAVLERVVDTLIQRFPTVGRPISETEMQAIRSEVVRQLQTKYPNSGITLRDIGGG